MKTRRRGRREITQGDEGRERGLEGDAYPLSLSGVDWCLRFICVMASVYMVIVCRVYVDGDGVCALGDAWRCRPCFMRGRVCVFAYGSHALWGHTRLGYLITSI